MLNDAGVVESPFDLVIIRVGMLEELVIHIACIGGVWLSGHSFSYHLGGESYPCSSRGASHCTEEEAIAYEASKANEYAHKLLTCREDSNTISTAKAFIRAVDSWRSEPVQLDIFNT